MIACCSPIGHGKIAIAYALNPDKQGIVLHANGVSGTDPDELFEQFDAVNGTHSRIANKYLRFEIGIAPADETGMTTTKLREIVCDFARRMGLDEYQWIAATHRNTDNLHVHLIANRVSLSGQVYQTNFVSNRSARIAEEVARVHNLVIANEQRRSESYKRTQKADPQREQVLEELRQKAMHIYAVAGTFADLTARWSKEQIQCSKYIGRSGRMLGLTIQYKGYVFKASEIDRCLGYKTLRNHFEVLAKQKAHIKQPTPKVLHSPSETGVSPSALKALRNVGRAMSTITPPENRRKDQQEEESTYPEL